MIPTAFESEHSVEVRRTYNASPEKVFAAWTQPEFLKKWWGVADGYTVPIAEVDLQVGGKYRLGMLPPNGDSLVVLTGEYRVIQPPQKLVFTWRFENRGETAESLITLVFLARGHGTELILTHEYRGTEAMAKEFRMGWEGMFARLEHALARVRV